ncbi:MAG: ATP-binding cassette domain-containing protein [Leptospira sp.]|nr:ATP-binding cassette domain-containing protein [Leptospira sp.]
MIQLRNLISIKKGTTILDNFSLDIQPGEHWIFLGRNGAGKTTLINFLYGYDWPTSGEVIAFGERYGESPLRPIQEKIGIMEPSHQGSLLQKNLSVQEILITGIHKTIGIYRKVTREQEILALDTLRLYGLDNLSDRFFSTLSSGEKSKILLLRSVISAPELLILDEPTANLDLTARLEFFRILEEVGKSSKSLNSGKLKTSILITHRIEEIPDFYTHICLLKNGCNIASGPIGEVLTVANLMDLYDLSEVEIRRWVKIPT